MKTRFLIFVGIIISLSIVSIPLNTDQIFAFCDAHSEPCFERIKTFDKIDDHFVRNYFFDYADDVFVHYDWPNKSDNVANNFDGFPAVYCFEIIANDEPHFLMANWIDHQSISNIVDMYVPELCEQSINPINSENRPDSMYVNKLMKTLTPESDTLMLSTPDLPFDDLQSCLLGDFDDKNYGWCDNYKEKIKSLSPLQQIKSGISYDEIQCKENLILVQKYNDSPACVKPETKQNLIDRGWAKSHKNPLQIIIPHNANNSSNLNFILQYDHFKSGNFIEIINQDNVTHDITGEHIPQTNSFNFHIQLEPNESWKNQIISNYDIELISKDPLTDKPFSWMSKTIYVEPRQARELSYDAFPPEPDTGVLRYGLEMCSYYDKNGNHKSCMIEGWSKRASELDCEKICSPPPTKNEK